MAVNQVIAPPPLEDEAFPAIATTRRPLVELVVVGTYLALGLVAFWPVFPGILHRQFSVDGDFDLTVWFLSWMTHSITHGVNPFFSNAIFVPAGVNLAQNTEGPLLGLITAPLASVLGPIGQANLLMVLAMPASATAAFVVLRKWEVWIPAAAVGGLLYGFSPYMVGQGVGHPVLLFLPLPPFIALTVASIHQRRGSPRRLGIQLGLLLVGQYLISQELFATVVLFTVVAVVCVAVRRPSNIRELGRSAAGPVGVALAVVAVVLAYPVWMMLAGPEHATGSTLPLLNPYHNDLLSFVVPGPLQKVVLGTGGLGARVLGKSNATEAAGYLGVPLLILGGVLAWRSRRSPRMQLTMVLFLVAGLLSLGPYLAVDGRLTSVPLPFLVLDHLPLLGSIVPSRISYEMDACFAALLAFGLDDLRRIPLGKHQHSPSRPERNRGRWSAALAVVTVVVLGVTQLPRWPYTTQSVSTLPAALRIAVPPGDPVAITYPYDTDFIVSPMVWQADDAFGFRLLGGYAYHPGPSGAGSVVPAVMHPSGLQRFLAGQEGVDLYGRPLPLSPGLVATTRATLAKYHVQLVLVDRSSVGSGPVSALFNSALGAPKVSAGHFELWAGWPTTSPP